MKTRPVVSEDSSTRSTLLSRVADLEDHAAWREFEARYRDLLLRFCRRRGLQLSDAEDVSQQVFAGLAKALSGFVRDKGRGRFRAYLFRCVQNGVSRWAARQKGQEGRLYQGVVEGALADASDGDPGLICMWEEEWTDHHYRLAMSTVRETFDVRSVEIFDRSVAGATVAQLAMEFGMTENAVHKVRQRIRARMEELIAEQVRDEDEC